LESADVFTGWIESGVRVVSKQIGVGTFTATDAMRERVIRVLDSGRLSYGDQSKELERRFAAMHESKFAVLSNSGTSSLQVALQAMKELHGWEDGDEVLIPAVTFVATANIVLHNRMTPVLVDIDPLYYEMDETLIESAITDRTRAIIPVHLFGQACNMSAITAIAQEHNLVVIEDSCEAMFVSHEGKRVGAWGDIGCFSTYVAHLLTSGVGGLATTSNPDYAMKMRSLVNHGRDGIYFEAGANHAELVSKRFSFDSIGHSFRITELEAAIALAQLDGWEGMLAARNRNANYLIEHLDSEHLQLPTKRPNTEHAWMMFPLVVLDPIDKWDLLNYLEEHGIETREMLPLTNQPCYAWNESDYPVAAWVNRFGLYLGCHQGLTTDDLNYIVECLRSYER
jgi:perosamine synthetase